jgi:alpha-mannosidase
MTGRGKGALPLECSLFTLEGAGVQVTAVKQAEDGHGLIVRLLNPLAEAREAKLTFGHAVAEAALCRLDEGVVAALASCCRTVAVPLPPKKIATVKVKLARGA